MAIRLSDRSLGRIAALGVPVPHYRRGALVPRIVHLGVGAFHRAHMALYTDDAAGAGGDWGICGSGLLETDASMADALKGQDYLYTLIERDNDGSRPRVVGSIVDYALAAGNETVLARRLSDPDVAILSLTITEGGYTLAPRNPTIEAIVSALDARRLSACPPLTILSCDNLPANGDAARDSIAAVAAGRSRDLASYIEECTFPNSMVDRIAPQTSEQDRAWLRDEVGIDDAWPVVSEPFRQWVIEDAFVAGRPQWETAGALFTDRVHDWELYKLRMLNASHSCIAYLMALAGVTFVDEAIAIPAVRSYLERFLETEAIPTLREIPEHPAHDYARTVVRRFENANVRDRISRLCIDGTSKFPSFLIPTIETQVERGGPVDCAALALAGWARYLATVPAAERAPDPHANTAIALAEASLGDPLTFLELDSVFTPSLRHSHRFRETFAAASRELAAHSPLNAIETLAATVEPPVPETR